MANRWYSAVIVLFWLTTMSWLMLEKVLPPLQRGNPPSYESIYTEATEDEPPVCWNVSWNGRLLGWGVSRVENDDVDLTSIRSTVHFDRLPLEELAPAWTRVLIGSAIEDLGEINLHARSVFHIDSGGRLLEFHSRMQVDQFREDIEMHGQVDGPNLNLTVQSAGMTYKAQRYLPEKALVGDELSPQPRMPRLKVGQRWTMEVYSPLRPPTSPMEILEATVEGTDWIVWNGKGLNVLLVVYRNDSGLGFLSKRDTRAKLWVREDGTVLKQEVNVYGSNLTFVRATPDEADEILAADEEWIHRRSGRGRRGGRWSHPEPAEKAPPEQPVQPAGEATGGD